MTLAAALALPASTLAQEKPPALKGHDPVAYFTDGRPVKGASSIAYEFDESKYLFSSAKNRELFAAHPDRYSPQFSGLCTVGLSMGKRVEADPTVWKIVDGKLYVFSSVRAREAADEDPSLFAKAQQAYRNQ